MRHHLENITESLKFISGSVRPSYAERAVDCPNDLSDVRLIEEQAGLASQWTPVVEPTVSDSKRPVAVDSHVQHGHIEACSDWSGSSSLDAEDGGLSLNTVTPSTGYCPVIVTHIGEQDFYAQLSDDQDAVEELDRTVSIFFYFKLEYKYEP